MLRSIITLSYTDDNNGIIDLSTYENYDGFLIDASAGSLNIILWPASYDGMRSEIERIDTVTTNTVTITIAGDDRINDLETTSYNLPIRSRIVPVSSGGIWNIDYGDKINGSTLVLENNPAPLTNTNNSSVYVLTWTDVSNPYGNFSDGVYTAPFDGLYQINVSISYSVSLGAQITLGSSQAPRFEVINSANDVVLSGNLTTVNVVITIATITLLANSSTVTLSGITRMAKSDTLKVQYNPGGATLGSISLSNESSQISTLSIMRIAS